MPAVDAVIRRDSWPRYFRRPSWSAWMFPRRLSSGRLAQHSDWVGLRAAHSEVRRVPVDSARTAQMFLMNFRTWRHQEFVREHHAAQELDELERELGRIATSPTRSDAILFGHRRLV